MKELNVKIFDETKMHLMDEHEVNNHAIMSEQEMIKMQSQQFIDSSSRNSRKELLQRPDVKLQFVQLFNKHGQFQLDKVNLHG